jgi:formylglycine-generating enzyme required for sulfatase activity
MFSVCVLRSNPEYRDLTSLEEALSRQGNELVAPEELARDDVTADCLISIVDDDQPGSEFVAMWLALVNRTRVDILLTRASSRIIPAQAVISIPREVAEPDCADLSEHIQMRFKSLLENSPNIPRLMFLPDSQASEYVTDSSKRLIDLLADDTKRIVGATLTLQRSIRETLIGSRSQYDLARFVRWSQDRLDTSFVKLNLQLAGGESTGSTVNRQVTSLADVLDDSRTSNLIVLKGAPGAGKSLQLRFLETLYAINSIRAGSPDYGPLAFCVSLGDHAAGEERSPYQWLKARWEQRVRVEGMQDLDVRLRHGRMLVLLDGFNEIPFGNAEDRRRWMLRWRAAIHDDLLKTVTNYAVVACRSRDLTIGLGTNEMPQTLVEMIPLSKEDILRIAEQRDPAAATKLDDAVSGDPTLLDLYRTPFSLSDYLEYAAPGVPRTQSAIFYRRIASALQRERDHANFQIFDRRWLPDDAVSRFLDQGPALGGWPMMSALPLLSALGALAHDLTQVGANEADTHHQISLGLQDAIANMQGYLRLDESSARDALFAAADLDLLAVNEGIVRFNHQTLQEFFAASTLPDADLLSSIEIPPNSFASKLGPLGDVINNLGPGDTLPVLPSTGFEEIFARATEFRPALIARAAKVNPWVARERLKVSDLNDTARRATNTALISELRDRLETTEDLRERIACLDALGDMNWNPRTGGSRGGAPVVVSIPANHWQVGAGEELRGLLASTQRRGTVELDEMTIGTFPVTNREFRRFVEAGGYTTERYWSIEGWTWRSGQLSLDEAVARWFSRRDRVTSRPKLPLDLLRAGSVSVPQAAAIVRFGSMTDEELREIVAASVTKPIDSPAFWDKPNYNNPLQPVVGVSWYEANAYCKWLSEQLGQTVRLLTENEWEAAAVFAVTHGTSGSVDDIRPPAQWDSQWGNTAELHLGRPSPAGVFSTSYPAAQSAPCDMFGNVFEWVLDVFQPGDESRRVCKGGSWRHLVRRACPAYRGRGDVVTRNDDDGFRILLVR